MWASLILICIVEVVVGAEQPAQDGITAFDCNSTHMEVMTFDLNHVEECQVPPNITSSETRVKVQILQKRGHDVLMVKRCHVTAQTLMWHCGMHSHSTIANYHIAPRPITLTANECMQVHASGTLTLNGQHFTHLQRNSTTITESTVVGSVWGNGECSGGSITINGYAYKDVVMKTAYTISIYESRYYYATGTEEITSFGGVTCKLSELSCYDYEVGTIVWSMPERECLKTSYETLYAGQADMIMTQQLGPNERYIRVSLSNEAKFQIFTPLLRYEPLCGLDGWATPYHGLYVITYRDRPPFPLNRPLVPNVDIVRYIETKFMTFAFGSALSLLDIIQTLNLNQCKAYRETLLNRLHIIATTPSSASLLLDNKPGVYGRVSGEVVHIMQCPPVIVRLRRSRFCTLEIPIVHNQEEVYMDPRSRIITDTYTSIECSILTPIMFRHGPHWVKMTPYFSPADPPTTLTPNRQAIYKFNQYTSYAQGGIYDPHDLQKVREFMLFSSRRDAMASNILNGIEGKGGPKYDLTQAMSAEGWKNLAKDRLKQMWGGFQAIGEVVSGFVGIYFCIVVVKTVFGIVVRCLNIYSLTGWSCNLLAAVWTSATQYVVTRHLNPTASSSSSAPWYARFMKAPSAPADDKGNDSGDVEDQAVIATQTTGTTDSLLSPARVTPSTLYPSC